MSKTIEMIKSYVPYNEQEEKDKQLFIECEEKLGDILNRTNSICHLCSSAFVVNSAHTKMLGIYHNLFQSWTFPGGHADGEDDMLSVAKRELMEETSLKGFKLLSKAPIAIDAIAIHSHVKRGKFVSSHIHLNTTYLFEADESSSIQMCEDENSGVAWLTFEELIAKSNEPHMIKTFEKIISKIKTM